MIKREAAIRLPEKRYENKIVIWVLGDPGMRDRINILAVRVRNEEYDQHNIPGGQ